MSLWKVHSALPRQRSHCSHPPADIPPSLAVPDRLSSQPAWFLYCGSASASLPSFSLGLCRLLSPAAGSHRSHPFQGNIPRRMRFGFLPSFWQLPCASPVPPETHSPLLPFCHQRSSSPRAYIPLPDSMALQSLLHGSRIQNRQDSLGLPPDHNAAPQSPHLHYGRAYSLSV